MPSKEMDKYIKWGLLVSTVVFLILSIVFIILFATKHEDSSGFMLTSTTDQDVNAAEKEIRRVLNNKYYVNSLNVNEKDGIVTSVFSLRDHQSEKSVLSQFSDNKILRNVQLTDGEEGYSVCHGQENINVITTAPDNETSTASTTTTTTTTTKAPIPPVTAYYCDNAKIYRDIFIVVDLLPPMDPKDDRNAALNILGHDLQTKISFGPTRIFIFGADGSGFVQISTSFAENSADFQTAWNTLIAHGDSPQANEIDLESVFKKIKETQVRDATPVEIILLVAHGIKNGGTINSQYNLKNGGVFVSAVKATQLKIADRLTPSLSTGIVDLNSWADVASADPFAKLVCQFTYQDNSDVHPQQPPQLNERSLRSLYAAIDDVVNNKCQRVDIIFVFDVSQSVIQPYLESYKTWAKLFAQRFTLDGAKHVEDDVNVGIIQFNDIATVVMPLQRTTQQAFEASVNTLSAQGGLTNTADALDKAYDQFTAVNNVGHGKFVIFMTDGEPTVGTLASTIPHGQKLAGIADIFFIGDGADGYDAEEKQALSEINNHPEWIYQNTTYADITLPQTVVDLFPCPIPICTMAYYAIEVSEATRGSNFLDDSINFVKQVAKSVSLQRADILYQLMLYNDNQYFVLGPNGGSSDDLMSALNSLQTDNAYLSKYISGHTRLDIALNKLTGVINDQLDDNDDLFQSSILIAGEANYYVLDPHCPNGASDAACEAQRKQQLTAAAGGLKARTPNVFAYDGSVNGLGDDLWDSVVDTSKTVRRSSKTPLDDLTREGYFTTTQSLTCVAPTLQPCYYTFLDIAFVLDIVGDSTQAQYYISNFTELFQTTYTTHVSMYAMGSGQPVKMLGGLQAYQTSYFNSLMFWEYGRWKEGEAIYTTTEAPTTEATTAAPKAEDEAAAVPPNYPMTADILKQMFATINGQYGCNHYGDDFDRIRAPNIVIIISDNFGTYTTDMWNSFNDDINSYWACNDCPGKPHPFYFISLNDKMADPNHISWNISGDLFDLSKHKSVIQMNEIVNTVCGSAPLNCISFDVDSVCRKDLPW